MVAAPRTRKTHIARGPGRACRNRRHRTLRRIRGRIRAQQFVEIRARVEGFLEKMLFEEGTYVKKGQPLFIIDPKLYEAWATRRRHS